MCMCLCVCVYVCECKRERFCQYRNQLVNKKGRTINNKIHDRIIYFNMCVCKGERACASTVIS